MKALGFFLINCLGLWLLNSGLYAQSVRFNWVSTGHLNYAIQPVMTRQAQANLRVSITLPTDWQTQPVTVRLLRNGQKAPPEGQKLGVTTLKPAKEGVVNFSQQVSLLPGENSWEVEVTSGKGEIARSQPLRIIHKPGKPVLHLLCVGVPYNLTYTQRDAAALFAYFKTQEGGLFGKVNGQVLVCDDETRFSRLGQSLTNLRHEGLCAEDVLLVSFSGHGKPSSAFGSLDFGLVTNDAQQDVHDDRYVLFFYQKDIIRNLEMISCKRIVLLDACHSGVADGNKNWIGSFDQAQAILNQTPAGIVTLVSSTGEESSYENAVWQHGAFTKAILEGLLGKANTVDKTTGRSDAYITIGELAHYVVDQVPAIVSDRLHRPQHPQFIRPPEVDYPIFALHPGQKIDWNVPACKKEGPLDPTRQKIALVGISQGTSDVDGTLTNLVVGRLKSAWTDKEVNSGVAQAQSLVRDGTLVSILDGYKSDKIGGFKNIQADQLCIIARRNTEYMAGSAGEKKWKVRTTVEFTFLDVKTGNSKDFQSFTETGTGLTKEVALDAAIQSAITALIKSQAAK